MLYFDAPADAMVVFACLCCSFASKQVPVKVSSIPNEANAQGQDMPIQVDGVHCLCVSLTASSALIQPFHVFAMLGAAIGSM